VKLWIVTVEVDALVLAETAADAREFSDDIVRDVAPLDNCASARPYRGSLPMNWDADAFVYHDGNSDLTARDAGDSMVCAYCPALLKLWSANMDIQLIGHAAGAAAYVTAYLTKSETDGVRDTIRQALCALPEDAPPQHQLRRACMAVMSEREISMQEATYLLLGTTLHLRGSSRAFVKLSTLPKARRPVIASATAFRANANPDGEVQVASNIYDYYAARPFGSTAAVAQRAAVVEDADADTPCAGCGDRECDEAANVMLLCSTRGCPVGCHARCLQPAEQARAVQQLVHLAERRRQLQHLRREDVAQRLQRGPEKCQRHTARQSYAAVL
jgi:hypothetical protein